MEPGVREPPEEPQFCNRHAAESGGLTSLEMTMTDRMKTNKGVNRRTLLKGAASVAGLAAGSGAITGFPYVMSAEPKVLRYLGTAVNEGDDISKKCFEDTGIKIEYIT